MKDDELRARFEAHYAKIYPNFGFKRFSSDMQTYSGKYTDSRVNTRWEAWQACYSEMQDVRRDADRLDWMDANAFTAYRGCDSIDGLSSHCVVVHEKPGPRRGNVADTIRQAIDTAMGERHG